MRTGTARLPQSERDQMRLTQSHAFDHFLYDDCDGTFPTRLSRKRLRCPICLRMRDLSEMTLDHVPQAAEQSRLGVPWATALTCDCNNSAGRTFESDAAAIARSGIFDNGVCPVHGDAAATGRFDHDFMDQVVPTTLSDLKSAYLMAFLVLGYSWCTASRLAPVRKAIQSGTPAPTSDALVSCGLASPTLHPRTVIEVLAPSPLVLVVGEARRVTVALPTDHTADVDAACRAASGSTITSRLHRWPLTVKETAKAHGLDSEFRKPEAAWDEGMLFHLDRRCTNDHSTTISRRRDGVRAVYRSLANG